MKQKDDLKNQQTKRSETKKDIFTLQQNDSPTEHLFKEGFSLKKPALEGFNFNWKIFNNYIVY